MKDRGRVLSSLMVTDRSRIGQHLSNPLQPIRQLIYGKQNTAEEHHQELQKRHHHHGSLLLGSYGRGYYAPRPLVRRGRMFE